MILNCKTLFEPAVLAEKAAPLVDSCNPVEWMKAGMLCRLALEAIHRERRKAGLKPTSSRFGRMYRRSQRFAHNDVAAFSCDLVGLVCFTLDESCPAKVDDRPDMIA